MSQPTDIAITPTTAGRIAVVAPYNTDWTTQARAFGGRWDAARKAWTFDARDEDRVRAALVEIYGSDGSAVAETVTIRVDLDKATWVDPREGVIIAGRTVARRIERDKPVLLKGAVVIAGGFDSSGGSVKNPRLDATPGTVLEVRDVPAGHADTRLAGVTVVSAEVDRDALAAERAALVARLAEIDALLAS
jgi:hypothetical protein